MDDEKALCTLIREEKFLKVILKMMKVFSSIAYQFDVVHNDKGII